MTRQSTPASGGDQPDLCRGELEETFRRLFDEHAAVLHRYLVGRIGVDIAGDLLSETFLVALQQRDRYDSARGSARSWLFGIATNLLRMEFRKEVATQRRQLRLAAREQDRQVVLGPADRVAERLDAQTRVQHLAEALADLAPNDLDVLLLASWADLAPTEIGEALGVPAGTVRSRLHRIRRLLRTSAASSSARDEEGVQTDD
jgi:RNA polymerase sigma factor (sigma-70 family)